MGILYMENRDGWKGDRNEDNGEGHSTPRMEF